MSRRTLLLRGAWLLCGMLLGVWWGTRGTVGVVPAVLVGALVGLLAGSLLHRRPSPPQ